MHVRSDQQRVLSGELSAAWRWRPELFVEETLLFAWRSTLQDESRRGQNRPVQVYVHVPFCRRPRCRYCMYFSRPLRESTALDGWLDSLVGRLVRWHDRVGVQQATNAYIGGGTPSLLSASQIERLLAALNEAFSVRRQFTFEANPAGIDEAKAGVLAHHGVNRVSLGVQALDPEMLRVIGRNNPPVAVIQRAVRTLQERGILVNLDLVLGLPGQRTDVFREDLRKVLEIAPDSVTVYLHQSTDALGSAPDAIGYRQGLGPRTLLEALSRGYVLRQWPFQQPEPQGVTLLRATRPVRRELLQSLKAAMTRGDAVPYYLAFDNPHAHLVGFGTGAFSHMVGWGWFRDVSAAEKSEAVLCGTRVTPEEDAALAVVAENPSGSRHNARSVLGKLAARPIVPLAVSARRLGLDPNVDLEPGLTPGLRNRPDPLLEEWHRAIGAPTPGSKVERATLESLESRRATFLVGPDGDSQVVTVQIDRAGSGKSMGESKRFALTWIPDGQKSLTRTSQDFLSALLDKTRLQDR